MTFINRETGDKAENPPFTVIIVGTKDKEKVLPNSGDIKFACSQKLSS